ARRRIHDVQSRAANAPVGQHAHDLSRELFTRNEKRRNQRDAAPREHRLLQEGDVVGGDGATRLNALFDTGSRGQPPRKRTVLRSEHDAIVLRQVRESLRLASSLEVFRGRVQSELHGPYAPRDQRLIANVAGADREVESFGDEIDSSAPEANLDTDAR